jgi:membrane-associated phospholipid phosphatase
MIYAVTVLGLRVEHVVCNLAMLILGWIGPRARRVAVGFLPFWLTAVAYDSQRLIHHLRAEIHVADLYQAEVAWFGVNGPSGLETLAEYFHSHTWVLLDLICGLAYIFYVIVPIAAFVWFLFRRPQRASLLAWAFLLVNLMGLVTYLVYPAAPPWYVQLHGLGPAQLDVAPSPAGTARFDALVGVPFFTSFYGRNPNVFGAMPSLHAAYPFLLFCVVAGLGWVHAVLAGLFALLVGFSAIYLQHHYVWDVLLGWLYAVLAYASVHRLGAWSRARLGSRVAAPVLLPGRRFEPVTQVAE